MRRSVFFLAAAALLIFAPGRAGAGEDHGWRGEEGAAHDHGPWKRHSRHHRRHRHGHGPHLHGMESPEPVYAGTMLVELRDPYLPPGILYNVPGPPPVYAHSRTVIRAKY